MRPRSVLPLVALSALLIAVPASAATTTVNAQGFAFVGGSPTIAQGDQVTWDNKDAAHHTATRTAFPDFSIDMPGAGDSGTQTFTQAGAFAYRCSIHASMTGTVKVRIKASPATGSASTTFTITVATAKAAPGSTYVIQRKAPGRAFTTWKTTTGRSVTFKSSTKGTWSFRSKIVKSSSGAGSGYSPSASISIK